MIKIDNFTKNIIKKSLKSICFFGSIYIIYNSLSMSGLFPLMLTILGLSIFKDAWSKILVPNSKKYIISMVVLSIIFTIISYSVVWGVWGFILVVLALAAYKIIRGRKMFMDGIRQVETQMFGETLDKKQCSKNETEVKQ